MDSQLKQPTLKAAELASPELPINRRGMQLHLGMRLEVSHKLTGCHNVALQRRFVSSLAVKLQ
jgi:hypothetical protein